MLAKSDFPPTTAIVLSDSSRKVLFRYPEPQKYIGKMLPDVLIKAMTRGDEGVAAGVGLPGDPASLRLRPAIAPLAGDVGAHRPPQGLGRGSG